MIKDTVITPVTIKELEHAIQYIEGFIHENNSQYEFWLGKKKGFMLKLEQLKEEGNE